MSKTELNKNIGLIHAWLIENHLLKTSRALEAEVGQEIQTPIGADLKTILHCYSALSCALLSSLNGERTSNLNDKKVNTKKTSGKKPTKKKTDIEVDKPKDDRTDDMSCATIKDTEFSENAGSTTQKLSPPKKKKKPFMPPGVWVCPEMQSPLERLYNRVSQKNLSNLVDVKDLPPIGQTTPSVEEVKNVEPCEINMDSKIIENEELLAIDNTVLDKTIDTTIGGTKKKKKKKKDRNRDENDNKEDEVITEYNEGGDKSEIELSEQVTENDLSIEVKKKKKKRKRENKENELENIEDPTLISEEYEFKKPKKHKLKKIRSNDVDENDNQIVEETPEESTPKKKKKKKKQADESNDW